jgi:hypothetical protein
VALQGQQIAALLGGESLKAILADEVIARDLLRLADEAVLEAFSRHALTLSAIFAFFISAS